MQFFENNNASVNLDEEDKIYSIIIRIKHQKMYLFIYLQWYAFNSHSPL